MGGFSKFELSLEMQIFFIYDVTYCKREEDDPKDAIIYFYPPQLSESKKCSLCCQLVGFAQFFDDCFSIPLVVNLAVGKFVFRKWDEYLLVLGGNSIIADYVLKKQMNYLCDMFSFFHKSIRAFRKRCNNDLATFLEQMATAWKSLILLSQCSGNRLYMMFDATPVQNLIKEESNTYVKSEQLLQSCQNFFGVIAGCIFCADNLISTQLTPEITRYMNIARICPDLSKEREVNYQLPAGIRLLRAYISDKDKKTVLKMNQDIKKKSNWMKSEQTCSSFYETSDELSSGIQGDNDSESSQRGKIKKTAAPSFLHSNIAFQSRLSEFGVYCECNKAKDCCSVLFPCALKNTEIIRSHENLDSRKVMIDVSTYQKEKLIAFSNFTGCESFNTTEYSKFLWKNCNRFSKCNIDSLKISPVAFEDWPILHSPFTLASYCASYLKKWRSEADVHKHISAFRTLSDSQVLSSTSFSKESLLYLLKNQLKAFLSKSIRKKEPDFFNLKKNVGRSFKPQTFVNKQPLNDSILMNSQGDSSDNSSSSFEEYAVTSTPLNRVTPETSSGASYVSAKSHSEDSSGSVNSILKENALHEIVLVLQNYNNSFLMLMVEDYIADKPDIISSLWKSGLRCLGDLKIELKTLSRDRMKEENSLDFHYLSYSKIWRTLKGHPSPLQPENKGHRSIQLLHQDFQENPKLNSISVVTATKMLHANKNPKREIYYHRPKDGGYKAGIPSLRDSFGQLPQKAAEQIEEHQETN